MFVGICCPISLVSSYSKINSFINFFVCIFFFIIMRFECGNYVLGFNDNGLGCRLEFYGFWLTEAIEGREFHGPFRFVFKLFVLKIFPKFCQCMLVRPMRDLTLWEILILTLDDSHIRPFAAHAFHTNRVRMVFMCVFCEDINCGWAGSKIQKWIWYHAHVFIHWNQIPFNDRIQILLLKMLNMFDKIYCILVVSSNKKHNARECVCCFFLSKKQNTPNSNMSKEEKTRNNMN